jgi:hypothetical protein
MIEGLKPYGEYKESGSKWLGDVPVTWEVRNLRTLISKRAERNRPVNSHSCQSHARRASSYAP